MEEIWKPVEEYENLYLISNLGRLKRIKSERILNPFQCTNGYLQFRLTKAGASKNILAHRIIAKAFIPNPSNKPQINHKNGIRTDNSISNLEWCTFEENIADKVERHKNGFKSIYQYKYYKTKRKKKSDKSQGGQPIKVQQYNLNGVLIKEWNSIKEAGKELHINQGNIVNCCKNKRYTAGSYIWKYCS